MDNGISDRLYRSQDLTDAALFAHIDATYPQRLPRRIWTLPSALVSAIDSVPRQTTLPRDSIQSYQTLPVGIGKLGRILQGRGPRPPNHIVQGTGTHSQRLQKEIPKRGHRPKLPPSMILHS